MKLAPPPTAFLIRLASRVRTTLTFLPATLALVIGVQRTAAQSTAFTYQGALDKSGAPASGNYDFAFALYTDPQAGAQAGSTITNTDVAISNGLFSTTLDFAGAPWNGQPLWLQILVRTNGNSAFSPLTPRQPVTSAPYSIQSLNAATAATASTAISANSVAATNLTGTILNSALPSSPVFAGNVSAVSYSGDGGGVTNLNPANLAPGIAAINISGNASSATSAALAVRFTGLLSGDVGGNQAGTMVLAVGGVPAASVATGANAANAATSANTPGAIVLRDASGNFAAGTIAAGLISGDGGGVTNLNPANLVPGTAAINISGNAASATSAGLAANATAAVSFTGPLSGDVVGSQAATMVVAVGGQSAASIAGGVTAANAATSANTPGTIVIRDASGNFAAGTIAAGFISGDGSGLANLNPANLAAGTAAINISGNAATATTASSVTGNIVDSQLPANVPLLDIANSFTETNEFAGVTIATNVANLFGGTFTGNLTGNLTGNATTATSAGMAANAGTAGNFTGPLAGDVTGLQGATVVAVVGGQSAASVASGAAAANAATSANTGGAIVARDPSGNFSAGAIAASAFSGDGSGLTNLNPAALGGGTAAINISGNAASATSASNVTGNIADFQLSTNVPVLNGTNAFSGTNRFAGVTIATNINNVFNGTFTGNLSGNATTATSALSASTATTATTATTANSANSATTAVSANNFTGSLLGQVTGTQNATTVLSVGGQSAANVASGSSAANAATSVNTAGTIVKRDVSGNFSAGAITATSVSGAFNGNGSGLTNLNPAQLDFGASENIDIAATPATGESNTIRIGSPGNQTNAYFAGIFGVTAASGVPVFITSSNHLGTLTSSRKFKQDIRNMDGSSDALLELRPVTFRYKTAIDPDGIPQFGLIAEEVEKVDPDLVAHDAKGQPYTVRYEAVNALLLNEFLKEHRKVQAQSEKIDELTQRLDRLERMVPETAEKK